MQIDTSKYDILFDRNSGEWMPAFIGAMRTKSIRSGKMLEVECFPVTRVDMAAKREARRRATLPAQLRLNHRNTEKRIIRLAECNFDDRDFVVHPTFDYGFADRFTVRRDELEKEYENRGLPTDEEAAKRCMANFIRRLKRRWKKNGGDMKRFRTLWVMETTREPQDTDPDPMPTRYHYHMLVSGQGVLSYEDIESCWTYGWTKTQRVDEKHDGLFPLAKYMSKQRKIAGRWGHTRGMLEPVITTSDRKVSRKRARLVAEDVESYGRAIFEAIYPGFELMETPEVRFSDWIQGARIYARMRLRD